MRRITVNSNLRTYLKGFLKRRIRPKARKDSRDSAPRKHELSPLTTPALTMAPRLRAFTVSLPPPAAQAAGPHANRHKFRAFSSLRVPHRPGRPALLDEKVQRRFGCAPNLFFLEGKPRSNPEAGSFHHGRQGGLAMTALHWNGRDFRRLVLRPKMRGVPRILSLRR